METISKGGDDPRRPYAEQLGARVRASSCQGLYNSHAVAESVASPAGAILPDQLEDFVDQLLASPGSSAGRLTWGAHLHAGRLGIEQAFKLAAVQENATALRTALDRDPLRSRLSIAVRSLGQRSSAVAISRWTHVLVQFPTGRQFPERIASSLSLTATGLLLIGAARWRAGRSSRLDFLRGGAAVYMTVTGVVYFLLLRGVEVDTTIPWVNSVVHQVMPVVVITDWLIDPPAIRLTMRQGLLWLIYTLIRGAIVHFYPYPVRVRLFAAPTAGAHDRVV